MLFALQIGRPSSPRQWLLALSIFLLKEGVHSFRQLLSNDLLSTFCLPGMGAHSGGHTPGLHVWMVSDVSLAPEPSWQRAGTHKLLIMRQHVRCEAAAVRGWRVRTHSIVWAPLLLNL